MRQMKGHGSKFRRKKEAIIALLTQRNIEEAARSIGVVPNTLMGWMKEPEFEKGYRQAVVPRSDNRSLGCTKCHPRRWRLSAK